MEKLVYKINQIGCVSNSKKKSDSNSLCSGVSNRKKHSYKPKEREENIQDKEKGKAHGRRKREQNQSDEKDGDLKNDAAENIQHKKEERGLAVPAEATPAGRPVEQAANEEDSDDQFGIGSDIEAPEWYKEIEADKAQAEKRESR